VVEMVGSQMIDLQEDEDPGQALVGKGVMKDFQGALQRGTIRAYHADAKKYQVRGRSREAL